MNLNNATSMFMSSLSVKDSEVPLAKWVKRWPTDLATPSSSPAQGEIFSTLNKVPFHTAFHYLHMTEKLLKGLKSQVLHASIVKDSSSLITLIKLIAVRPMPKIWNELLHSRSYSHFFSKNGSVFKKSYV